MSALAIADHASPRSLRALDALAFFAPDVQGGVGPFLVVFMSSALSWAPDRIGTVMFASALVGLLVQAPAGALIDRVRAKPLWIAGAVAAIAASLVMMVTLPSYPVILAGQSVIGAAGTLVAPAVAAVSLGLVGRVGLDARVGRNAAVGAAGTVVWALGTGWIGHAYGAHAMFWFAFAMAVPTIVSALAIRSREIDPRLARGGDAGEGNAPAGRWYDRRLAVLLSCAFLFHLSNAAMLTLVAQTIGKTEGANTGLWLSAAVIITQLVTIPIGLAVGRWAPRLARKPIFLLAFAVLPVRGLLYLVVQGPAGVIGLQVLDGIGAGVFGVMLTLMVSDMTRGSGRFNFALGISAVAVGSGAALSNLVAGTIAQAWGYAASFVALAGVAAMALALFAFGMPETRRGSAIAVGGDSARLPSTVRA
jgi:MFS family permease